MPARPAFEALARLRHDIAAIEAGDTRVVRPPMPLGVAPIDSVLGGGLARGSLHEVAAVTPGDLGSAAGFAFALAGRAARRHCVLWIQHGPAALDAGSPYGPGLDAFGIGPERFLALRVRRPIDALWAMEEGLACPGVAAVIAELPERHVDLAATRRLSLAAQRGGAIGLLLRQRPCAAAGAAATRWRIAAARSVARDAHGGLGEAALAVALVRNRRGPCGAWILGWSHHERVFATISVDLAAASCDRPDRAVRAA